MSDTGSANPVARFADENTFSARPSDEYFTIFRRMKIPIAQLPTLFVPRESPLRRAYKRPLVKTKKSDYSRLVLYLMTSRVVRERKRKVELKLFLFSYHTSIKFPQFSFPRFALHLAREILAYIDSGSLIIRRDRMYTRQNVCPPDNQAFLLTIPIDVPFQCESGFFFYLFFAMVSSSSSGDRTGEWR